MRGPNPWNRSSRAGRRNGTTCLRRTRQEQGDPPGRSSQAALFSDTHTAERTTKRDAWGQRRVQMARRRRNPLTVAVSARAPRVFDRAPAVPTSWMCRGTHRREASGPTVLKEQALCLVGHGLPQQVRRRSGGDACVHDGRRGEGAMPVAGPSLEDPPDFIQPFGANAIYRKTIGARGARRRD
jgi:hypothetical protein